MADVRLQRYGATLLLALLLLTTLSVGVAQTQESIDAVTVELTVPAVAQRDDGSLVGVPGTLRVTMQAPGEGRVFVSAQPLTQIDMQASARLAVAAASSVSGVDAADRDFFFSVETAASTIGGPSAGGAMAVAATALLLQLDVHDGVVMTGMINPDASIGPVGGILQKVDAAAQAGADTFVVPLGQTTVVVTETQTAQGPDGTGTQTVQRPVDVTEYAQENHGIDVVEVVDLDQAVTPFTGHRLVRPVPQTDPLQDRSYREATAELSAELRTQAETSHAGLTARTEAQRGNMTPSDAQAIDTELADADDRIQAAGASAAAGDHYLAATHAFRALVALEHAAAIIGFHEQDDDAVAYVGRYLQQTEDRAANATGQVTDARPVPLGRLDVQGAAEIRALEATGLADAATVAYDQGNLADALRAASFARQRAASVDWWLTIGQRVATDAIEVPEAAVNRVLADYVDTVELDLQYAELIAGPGSPQVQAAKAAQQRAQQALSAGMPYAALFDLVEAVATANAALVALSGEDTVRQRLPDVEASAAYEIQLAASLGASPLYAISLLELAGETRTSDPATSYAVYSTSRLAARTVLLASDVDVPAAGVEPADALPSWVALVFHPAGQQMAVAVVGATAAAATGLVLATRWRDQ